MAYAQLVEFDVDLETHKQFGALIGDEPVKGLIIHAGGTSPNGVYSLDVWESKEDADRFLTERLMPALAAAGIEGGPPLSQQDWDLPYVLR